MIKPTGLKFLQIVLAMLVATFGGMRAEAQDYPTKPIEVIVPFAGGSASDVVTRVMFMKCRSRWVKTLSSTIDPALAAIMGLHRQPGLRRTGIR